MGRLLLLEDDPDLAEVMAEILRMGGAHQVERTTSGREAVVSAARGHWDLFLLDIDVGELSGLGVARALSDFAQAPTLIASGAQGAWESEAFDAGASACIRKPFATEQIVALVNTLVRHRRELDHDVERLSPADLERIAALTPEERDQLPYGAIELDRAGIVQGFNAYESAAVNLAPDSVVGRRFVELAPCVAVKSFLSGVERGFAERSLDQVLRFAFPGFGGLIFVAVRLFYDRRLDRMWLFVSRRARRPDENLTHHDE